MTGTLAELLGGRPLADAAQPILFDRGVPVAEDDFRAEVARLAGGLTVLGIKAGDRVAIWLPNVPAWLSTLFALARIGAIAVSVNTRYKSSELEKILARAEPHALICWPGFRGIDFAGILSGCAPDALKSLTCLVEYGEDDAPSVAERKAVDDREGVARFRFDELPAGELPGSAASPSSPCILFSTSGTTKEPKLVLHDQSTLVRHARNVAAAWRLGHGSAICLVPPFCGVYGLCTALAALAGGAPIWMRPIWDAAGAASDIVRGGCTHITGTDDAYAQLLDVSDEPVPYPSIRYAGYAPFNPTLTDIVARADARGLPLSGLYGASEVQALFSNRASEDSVAERGLAGGYPVDPAARVRTRDPATGAILPDGTVGELEILAPGSRMVGYFNDDAATAAALTDDGWYRTGDLGYTTASNGFVYLSRAGDSLRLGGFLVSPLEIEAAVVEAGGVKACQVVGVPCDDGLRPVAFVIPAEGRAVDEDALAGHLRARLASYKVPVRFFAIDEFPVTISANATKIRRDALRQRALDLLKT